MDIAENVVVFLEVSVEDKRHGKLSEDKTQLMRKRKIETFVSGAEPLLLDALHHNKKTHMEDDVKDRLEDDDVAVARSLRKLLLLLYVLLLVVDIFVVLLGHPAWEDKLTSVKTHFIHHDQMCM